ncbi:hypothetical protein [Lentzea flava]|uniref:Uncharacterized protein n=1 Tax=Lentzea flava TaxID=103732 RepID=A0ABQ2VGG0_9PSEU|nr:hypothetical protein [Lentzea flava]MCP2205340.1 hypothetical protein [Lentzea flava]GGU85720.1 hypothetical protein GCM10010178_89790 [Lentzea flava]
MASETTDALLCAPPRLESLPHLTLQPERLRGHGSAYAALAKGEIDTTALRRLLADAIQPEFGWCSPRTSPAGTARTR